MIFYFNILDIKMTNPGENIQTINDKFNAKIIL